jgi:hypothetical protein
VVEFLSSLVGKRCRGVAGAGASEEEICLEMGSGEVLVGAGGVV